MGELLRRAWSVSVIGVDPGFTGALACFDQTTGELRIDDMPTFQMSVGTRKRTRIDAVELIEYFELQKLCGAQLVVIEAVGGRPKQSAASAFQFGYGVGLLYMACISARIPIETVVPGTWKKLMRVPGKKDKNDGDIIKRADEVYPHHRELWRGPQGGRRVDRAEAALIARYAADFAINLDLNLDAWAARWKAAEEAA